MSDIYHLIDRLERLLNESWRMPLSAYLVINEDDFLDVIDQMRTAIPKEIREGERVQGEKDRLIAHAEEQAERIIQQAKAERDGLLEGHEVNAAAEQRASTIIERAQREAEVLKGEADEYAVGVLVSLDDQLQGLEAQIITVARTVRNGLETLSSEPEAPPEE